MKKWHLLILSTLSISTMFMMAACGNNSSSGGGSSIIGSCLVDGNGFTTCYDYVGSGMTTLNAQNLCANTSVASVNGTYSSSVCSTANRVGSCRIYPGQSSEQNVRYYQNGWNDTTAGSQCSSLPGTYTSG